MKMQKYIRILLALVLIVSNLSVAFSMHLCQGSVEKIKLNHLDNEKCKMEVKSSCCSDKKEVNHCETKSDEKNDDCCQDLSLSDEIKTQQIVPVFKISPITFDENQVYISFDFPDEITSISTLKFLDSYIDSNAPPIYILHSQLVIYEA